MSTTCKATVDSYLRAKSLSRGTRNEYHLTVRKWEQWGGGPLPESSVEILGHSVGGITYRHYAHRAPLAFKAIMTIPQPTAFSALLHGHDGECPCCRRPFVDAG
jgi:hypothetical protein